MDKALNYRTWNILLSSDVPYFCNRRPSSLLLQSLNWSLQPLRLLYGAWNSSICFQYGLSSILRHNIVRISTYPFDKMITDHALFPADGKGKLWSIPLYYVSLNNLFYEIKIYLLNLQWQFRFNQCWIKPAFVTEITYKDIK